MELFETIIAMAGAIALWAYTWWKDKNYQPGNPPLIPSIYLQILAAVAFFVLAAHLFSITTGITWQSPFRR